MKETTKIEDQIKKLLGDAVAELGFDIGEVGLEHPADEAHGEYSSNVALATFSKLQATDGESTNVTQFKNPFELAQTIADKINSRLPKTLSKCEVAGPGFLNFYVSEYFLLGELDRVIDDDFSVEKFVDGEYAKRRILVEHTSPNPNKAMHLGHLKNNVTGMAIANILEAVGNEVIRDCVDNNRGIAIAKLMWGYLKFARKNEETPVELVFWFENGGEWQTPEEVGVHPAKFVDDLYVKANEDVETDKEIEQRVRQMVVDWEGGDEATWALWEKVLSYSHEGQRQTLERLGNKWDKVWHEHEHYREGKEMVEQGLEKGIFKKLPDGAVVTDLEEEFGLSDTILQKKDGTALYITQDLALTKHKKQEFSPDKMLWVIGPEQSLAMKQMFAVCTQLGLGSYEDYEHIAYGFMSLKGVGKMSSRKGNVVYIDDLLNQAVEKARGMVKDPEIGAEEAGRIAEQVGVGAVKYSILRVGRLQNVAFDFEESVSLTGNSGPYVQYTFARCLSVIRRASNFQFSIFNFQSNTNDQNLNAQTGLEDVLSRVGEGLKEVDWQEMGIELNAQERAVLGWLGRFGETLERAADEYAPHLVASYVYELAQRFNTFYNQHSILSGTQDEVKTQNSKLKIVEPAAHLYSKDTSDNSQDTSEFSIFNPSTSSGQVFQFSKLSNEERRTVFRVALTAAVARVVRHSLELLGIEAPERM